MSMSHRTLETVHTGFCMLFLYEYLVEGFGDFAYFLHINWCVPRPPPPAPFGSAAQ